MTRMWNEDSNTCQSKVVWQVTAEKAWTKPKRLYPITISRTEYSSGFKNSMAAYWWASAPREPFQPFMRLARRARPASMAAALYLELL